jgi:hypothetical protein
MNFPHKVELHHYCSSLTDDFIQCAVYDGEGKDAKLVGIEYVITEKLFNTLSVEERKLWHSHGMDVKSGSFMAPKLPDVIEKSLLRDLVHTYGKTWLLWQFDRDHLPLGIPQLMMVGVSENHWKDELWKQREKRYTFWTREK